MTSGRRGLRPSEPSPATMAPAPWTAMIAPQTAAPPRYARPMTGPSSIQGAQVIRLKKANCTLTTHTHVRERNSPQPSPMSPSRLRCARRAAPGASAAAGMRSRPSASTLAANEAASAATTVAGPATATRMPPSAGPAILAAELASPYSAFALASWSGGEISTVSAFRAGEKNASPVPSSQASRMNTQSAGRPVNSTAASEACAAQRSTSAASITRRRPSRSATAPASGSITTWDTTPAVNTNPRPVAPAPASRTAQAIATVDIEEPSSEVTYPT
jgi:hypothetical protein